MHTFNGHFADEDVSASCQLNFLPPPASGQHNPLGHTKTPDEKYIKVCIQPQIAVMLIVFTF